MNLTDGWWDREKVDFEVLVKRLKKKNRECKQILQTENPNIPKWLLDKFKLEGFKDVQ